jgi:casein kinase 1
MKQANLNGFPEIKEAFETEGRAYLVLEELGNNIDSLRLKCGGRLGLKTVLMVGLQVLDRLEYLHKSELLHGDVKPSNFMVGKHKLKHKIYLSDF